MQENIDTPDFTDPQKTPAPRSGDPRLWFTWALAQYWFFEEAPRPMAYKTLEAWVVAFDKWAAESLSETCSWIARFILGFYNDKRPWKCGRSWSLHRAWANMDNGNRRGCQRLLEYPRFF